LAIVQLPNGAVAARYSWNEMGGPPFSLYVDATFLLNKLYLIYIKSVNLI